jgi:hypothetical protein
MDYVHRSFQRVLPCVQKNSISSFVHCSPAYVVLRDVASAPIEALLSSSPLFWYVTFDDLKPADMYDGVSAIRIVRVAGERPVLDTLYDYAAHVRCSVVLFDVPE